MNEKKSLMSDLAQMIDEASAEGEVPIGMQSQVDEFYQDFKVNWRNILKRFLSGRGKIIVRKSYKRQSRRFEDLPGTKRAIGANALVAIDESGSISERLITQFYQELKNINLRGLKVNRNMGFEFAISGGLIIRKGSKEN